MTRAAFMMIALLLTLRRSATRTPPAHARAEQPAAEQGQRRGLGHRRVG
jgi:hypothetical protein